MEITRTIFVYYFFQSRIVPDPSLLIYRKRNVSAWVIFIAPDGLRAVINFNFPAASLFLRRLNPSDHTPARSTATRSIPRLFFANFPTLFIACTSNKRVLLRAKTSCRNFALILWIWNFENLKLPVAGRTKGDFFSVRDRAIQLPRTKASKSPG